MNPTRRPIPALLTALGCAFFIASGAASDDRSQDQQGLPMALMAVGVVALLSGCAIAARGPGEGSK